jgi:ATP-binding cassette subfamily B protein
MIYISPFDPNARRDEQNKLPLRERLHNLAQSIRGSIVGIGQVLKLVWETNRLLTLGLGIFTLLQASIPALSIYITKLLIDTITAGIQHGPAAGRYLPMILLLAIVQLIISGLSNLFSTLSNTYRQLLQTATTNRIQYMIMAHANMLDLTFFEQAQFYDKLRNAQQEAGFRPVVMVGGVFELLRNLCTFFSMVALLVQLQWFLAIIALLTPIPAFISDARYGREGFKLTQKQATTQRLMYYLTHLMTTDTYHKEIKIFDLGSFFLERFQTTATRFYNENRNLLTRRSLSGFFWGLLTVLASSGTFLYVAIQALYGLITLGDVTLYTQAANSVQSTFQSLLTGVNSMYENNLYLSTLFEFLAFTPDINSPDRPEPLRPPFEQGIEFRHVTFSYPEAAQPALHDASFVIQPGETLAVVGRNGAGKTTLVKLLARLYDPQEGQILVNGRDIRDYDLSELRAEIGVIFQDYVRYYLTAQENIGVGRLPYLEDRATVEKAAAKSGANEVIAKLPDGYDSTLGNWFKGVGGKGNELSGGEWQKIALARGFMRDSQLLILDEPTASLDAKAEYELFSQIRELTRGRTAIFISHRFSTVRLADRILVLENGSVIEHGSHSELLALNGHYAELFNLQAEAYR